MDRGAEAAIRKEAVKAFSKVMQPVLDGLRTEYAGQPVDAIKPVLAERWAAASNGSISDPELTTVAQAISDDKRIVLWDDNLVIEWVRSPGRM